MTALGGVWAAYLLLSGRAPKSPLAPEAPVWDAAARADYLKRAVEVKIEVGPELKPGTGAPVGGVLRAKGEVQNTGDHTLKELVLVVLPLSVEGEVLSEQQEELLHGRPLKPGQRRPFSLMIPKSEAHSGRFETLLR